LCLGTSVVVRNNESNWVVDFSHYKVGGEALLVELYVIQMRLEFCRNKSYNNIVCENDYLEVVELVNVGRLIIHCTFMLNTSFILLMIYMRLIALH
jgi:hypothetical protein